MRLLRDQFIGVLDANSPETLRLAFMAFARHLGFERFNATAVVDRPVGKPRFVWVNNAPTAYSKISDNVEYGRLDPVAQHCKKTSLPLVWDQATYTKVGQGERWEVQAPFGYRTGISLALHLPGGRHVYLGVDRTDRLPRNRGHLTRMVADLQLFATLAQEAVMRTLIPTSEVQAPSLTTRELESLRWTMEGKTAWEIGRILGISEQTVARHIHNAMQKLDCVSKLQAVVKALRVGIIS